MEGVYDRIRLSQFASTLECIQSLPCCSTVPPTGEIRVYFPTLRCGTWHMTLFGQWNVSGHDMSTDLEGTPVVWLGPLCSCPLP